MSILIFSSSRNRFFVVVTVRYCCYPRWLPICLPKQETKYILAHRKATITNEVSNFIFSRSRNRFRIATIVCECYFPRRRPIFGQKHKNMYISAHIFVLALIFAAILKRSTRTLLPIRETDSWTFNI